MNILYINHYAGSLEHGMEFRPYYLAREWVRSGHNVTILASNVSHLRKHIDIPRGQKYLPQTIDGIQYVWCKTPEYSGNGLKRVINIFTFLHRVKKIFHEIIKGKMLSGTDIQLYKPDLVIASSTYPFDTRVAAAIAKKVNAKFVYEIHDLWPLTPIELSGMSPKHPFIRMMQKAEDFGYRNADKVVSLLPKAKSYMVEHGMTEDKFVYIPNGVSVDDWKTAAENIPQEHIESIRQLREKYTFLIGYAGGMGESNALGFLISAAKDINKNIGIVMVGNGSSKNVLQKRLMDENITNICFLPAIGKTQIPDFLKRMDALYIGWNRLSIYRFGICPNKLFDYMLAAKPVIHSVTAGNDLVRDAHCGISTVAEDVTSISKAIDKIANETPADLQWLGEQGHNYVIKHHDYPILAQRFLDECGVGHG